MTEKQIHDILTAIRDQLEQQGMSQAELARRIGTSKTRLSVTLRGQGNPRLSTLQAICEALGLELTALPRQRPNRGR